MISTRAVTLLLATFIATGCHKKAPATDAEAGAAADAATTATDDGGAADSASGDDSAADSAATDAGQADSGSDQGDDGGGEPTTVAGGGNYAGSYSCFGTLTLRQVANTVSGDAILRAGGKTTNHDVTCKIVGDKCSGLMNRFKTNAGGTPKPDGHSKVTFHSVSGGLEYTEVGSGGNTQTGFCKRN
jgi:hypothetical protein